MPEFDKLKAAVPALYVWNIIAMAEEAGLDRKTITAGLDLPGGTVRSVLSPRVSTAITEQVIQRCVRLAGDDYSLGYQLGLRLGLPTAGLLGVAAMTRTSVRSAMEFMVTYSRLFTGISRLRFFVEADCGVLDVTLPYDPQADLYRYIFDWAMVAIWRITIPFLGEDAWRDVELWFNYPEPEYYPAYRERLPRCRFAMGANQIRIPVRHLDRPLASGDLITAQQLEAQCREEMALLMGDGDIVERVSSLLRSEHGYPSFDDISTTLFMSRRTLSRRLQQSGTSFQQMLDDARRKEALELLKHSVISVERIADRLGYADSGAFSHAFRKWTGISPSAWRRSACRS